MAISFADYWREESENYQRFGEYVAPDAVVGTDTELPELDEQGVKLLPSGLRLAFCPTGPGGGKDPTCPPKNKGTGKKKEPKVRKVKNPLKEAKRKVKKAVAREKVVTADSAAQRINKLFDERVKLFNEKSNKQALVANQREIDEATKIYEKALRDADKANREIIADRPPQDRTPTIEAKDAETLEKGVTTFESGDRQSMDQWGEENFGEFIRSSLSKEEYKALENYTISPYVNSKLREGKSLRGSTYSDVKAMDAAFEKAPELTESVQVYRGLSMQYTEVGPGDVIMDTGFMSTSLNAKIAHGTFGSADPKYGDTDEKFAKMYITVPKGGKGIYLEGIGALHQQEFLLPRQSTLRIKRIEYDENNVQHIYSEVCYDC